MIKTPLSRWQKSTYFPLGNWLKAKTYTAKAQIATTAATEKKNTF